MFRRIFHTLDCQLLEKELAEASKAARREWDQSRENIARAMAGAACPDGDPRRGDFESILSDKTALAAERMARLLGDIVIADRQAAVLLEDEEQRVSLETEENVRQTEAAKRIDELYRRLESITREQERLAARAAPIAELEQGLEKCRRASRLVRPVLDAWRQERAAAERIASQRVYTLRELDAVTRDKERLAYSPDEQSRRTAAIDALSVRAASMLEKEPPG